MLLQTIPTETGGGAQRSSMELKSGLPEPDDTHTHILDYAPAPGWTVHVTKDGRLYYCK